MRLSSLSIGGRLARSLVLWSVLWCAALGAAVWVIVQEEVAELLDDTLQSAAEGLIGPLVLSLTEPVESSTAPGGRKRAAASPGSSSATRGGPTSSRARSVLRSRRCTTPRSPASRTFRAGASTGRRPVTTG